MEPVTSKTNARVDAPSGMSSFVAPVPVSCPEENATDSARNSHANLLPISEPRSFSSKVLGYVVLASRNLRVSVDIKVETSGSQKWTETYLEQFTKTTASAKDNERKDSLVVRVFGFFCSYCAQKSQSLYST